jgi:hypothetical protein
MYGVRMKDDVNDTSLSAEPMPPLVKMAHGRTVETGQAHRANVEEEC